MTAPDAAASEEPAPVGAGSSDASGLVVRGGAGDEELAALLAVLCSRRTAAAAPASGYEAWRAGRIAALGRDRPRP